MQASTPARRLRRRRGRNGPPPSTSTLMVSSMAARLRPATCCPSAAARSSTPAAWPPSPATSPTPEAGCLQRLQGCCRQTHAGALSQKHALTPRFPCLRRPPPPLPALKVQLVAQVHSLFAADMHDCLEQCRGYAQRQVGCLALSMIGLKLVMCKTDR